MYRYNPTDLECAINAHYQAHGIFSAAGMCIERIAESFGIILEFYEGPSFADWSDEPLGHRIIFLDKRLPEPERRAAFFHELTHPLRHCGRQDDLHELFVELQEIQAGQFQLAAALPSYILQDYDTVAPASLGKIIAEEFQLPLSLVMRRLEQIYNRILDAEHLRRTKRFYVPYGIDVSKPHVLHAIQDLRAIQRKRKEKAK